MKRAALAIVAALLGVPAAQAGSPYPVHIERQRGSTLVIEHTPVPARVGVRTVYRAKVVRIRKARAVRKVHRRTVVRESYVRNSAIAGGCWDGGHVRRRLPAGAVVVLHRDVCEGIAPISSLQGRY
jgi:hypothetical protein